MARHQELPTGFTIAGRYEVIKCLGSGSMGAVYACKHKELSGHIVAVKVLFSDVANDKISAARFRNEVFASYGVSHPNVVRAYEYVKENGILAYTMEYVEGKDLAEYLKNPSKLLPIDKIIYILIQMTAGVEAIHSAGIVHRDLKPENILIDDSWHVKIADFGIARTEKGPRLTEHGGVVGTIDYVSPEYMLNSQVDSRSDIYAIGILAFEMITGVTPFKGDTVYDTMMARLKKEIPCPSNSRSDCPKDLDKIILKSLKKDPDERYQSAKELHHDLVMLQEQISSGDNKHKTFIFKKDFSDEELKKEELKIVQELEESKNITPSEETQQIIVADKDRLKSVLNFQAKPVNHINVVGGVNYGTIKKLSKKIKCENRHFIKVLMKFIFLLAVFVGCLFLTDYFFPEYKIIFNIKNIITPYIEKYLNFVKNINGNILMILDFIGIFWIK